MKIRRSRPGRPLSRGGFSLMEIVIAVSILAILAASITPFVNGMVERSKVAKTLSLVDSLRTACSMHHADTGTFAREFANHSAANRSLSSRQSTNGWSGPYIGEMLRHGSTNPFGGNLHLYDSVTANGWIAGFDLDGSGQEDVTGPANMLWLANVPETAAEGLDRALDGNLQGDWRSTGRVRFDGSKGHAYILVYH